MSHPFRWLAIAHCGRKVCAAVALLSGWALAWPIASQAQTAEALQAAGQVARDVAGLNVNQLLAYVCLGALALSAFLIWMERTISQDILQRVKIIEDRVGRFKCGLAGTVRNDES